MKKQVIIFFTLLLSIVCLGFYSGADLYTDDINTPAKLESVANLGAYASDILAATSEANFKSITNLEAGTDFYSVAAADAAFEVQLVNEAGLYAVLSDVSNFTQPGTNETITGYWTHLIFRGTLAAGALGSIANGDIFWTDPDNYDPASTSGSGEGDDYLALKTDSGYSALLKKDGTWLHGPFQLPYSDSGDATLTEGYIQQKSDEDGIVYAFASDGEIPGEVFQSLIQHVSMAFDPTGAYDQESTYRSLPLFYVGDDFPHGITITEWKAFYVKGDPTTELDADIICDTTPDFNTGAGATVMDAINTTNGTSTADAGFDSGSCANGSYVYIHFGADPVDDNVLVAFDLWFYAEED